MGNYTTDYCPHCNKVVAPQDSERVSWGTTIFHERCIKAMRERANLRNEEVTLIWRGKESRIYFVPRGR